MLTIQSICKQLADLPASALVDVSVGADRGPAHPAISFLPATEGSEILDLVQASADHVVHEAAHRHFFGNPRVRSQFLQLMPHVFFDVLESVEKRGRHGGGAGAILDARAQLLLGGVHQPDSGEIYFDGKLEHIRSVSDASSPALS